MIRWVGVTTITYFTFMDFFENILIIQVVGFDFTSPDRAIVAKKQQSVNYLSK